jgi:hypothetical protein
MGEMRNAYKIYVVKLEDIGLDGRIFCIEMDLKEIRCECVNWIHTAQD